MTTKEAIKIEIIDVVEHEDGSATYTFDVNDAGRQAILAYYGRKRLTQKLFKHFMWEVIATMIKEKSK